MVEHVSYPNGGNGAGELFDNLSLKNSWCCSHLYKKTVVEEIVGEKMENKACFLNHFTI